jgi:hypothetical protein
MDFLNKIIPKNTRFKSHIQLQLQLHSQLQLQLLLLNIIEKTIRSPITSPLRRYNLSTEPELSLNRTDLIRKQLLYNLLFRLVLIILKL